MGMAVPDIGLYSFYFFVLGDDILGSKHVAIIKKFFFTMRDSCIKYTYLFI